MSSTPPQSQLIGPILAEPGIRVSYEFFPPKDKEALPKFYETVAELKLGFRPDFCSVTWGAGGSTVRNTIDIVSHLTHAMGLLSVSHFTCLGMTRPLVDEYLGRFAGTGIHNLLVLRGDKPHQESGQPVPVAADGFRYASELLGYIRTKSDCAKTDLSLLVAGYPEGHPETPSVEKDWDHLAHKILQGADGVVTQFFLDNTAFYRFRDGLKQRGVGQVPVSVGVMMVTKAKMIKRMIELSGCSVPAELAGAIERYGSDDASMEAFGIDYAVRQVADLMDQGVQQFHFYTLNQSGPTLAVLNRLGSRMAGRPKPAPRTVTIEYREYMAYPDSKLTDLFKKYGLDPNQPHHIVHNHALRRYEITQ